VLSSLRLKEVDLNFIDEDAAREIIFDHTNPSAIAAAERERALMVDNPGHFQYYRSR
jgi:hypothetical protein